MNQPSSASPPWRRAFTLVELLVVIGIIALLISILIPALSKAREQGMTIKCLSNMRSIMQAFHMYSNDNKGVMLPCGTNAQGWWCNLLVDFNYTKAPTCPSSAAATQGPMTDGNVFFCPSGNMEFFPPDLTNNGAVPANRQDVQGATCTRQTSPGTNTCVDLWYGINGDEGNSTTTGTPTRRIQNYPADGYLKTAMIRNQTEMVIIFDGLIYHHMNVNANRLNARHGNRRQTNLAFLDAHAETWMTADLPGGIGAAAVSDFSLANLRAKYNNQPLKWRLEQ
jgi:prepilin-type N-terminal cleavage/methylation domain-containing protein/prepilin-type processing-associated H-X9-DG protein